MLKIAKDVGIFINKVEILEYHYKLYMLSKSIYIISYISLVPAVYPFAEIYIDTIEYKLSSINRLKYVVYLLDRYFNYQWIFFIRIKEIIFEKFIEIVIYLENQINRTVKVIYLDNGIEFYPIELETFVIGKDIHLKFIILRTSNQNDLIKRTDKTIIDQIYISFITNGLFKRHWPYVEETAV